MYLVKNKNMKGGMEGSLWTQMKVIHLSFQDTLSFLDQGSIMPTGCSEDNL